MGLTTRTVRIDVSRVRLLCGLLVLLGPLSLGLGWVLLGAEEAPGASGVSATPTRTSSHALLPTDESPSQVEAVAPVGEHGALLDDPVTTTAEVKSGADEEVVSLSEETRRVAEVGSRSSGRSTGGGRSSLSPPGPAEVRGRVRDTWGRALVGVAVQVTQVDVLSGTRRSPPGFGSQLPRRTTSDSGGWFSIDGLPALPYQIVLERPGYATRYLASVTPGRETLELVLQDTHRIAGLVTDGRGRPLPGAAVSAVFELDGAPTWRSQAATREDGRFSVGVERGMLVRLEARKDGYRPARRQGVLEGNHAVRLRLTPIPRRPVRGIAVSRRTGEALSRFRVNNRVIQDAAGRFRTWVPSRRPTLTIEAVGFQPLRNVEVPSKGGGDLGRVALVPWQTLVGTVRFRSATGTIPASGAWLQVVHRGAVVSRGGTDATGAFALGRLPEGHVQVVVGAPGFVESTHELVLPRASSEGALDVVLTRGRYAVWVHVHDGESGAPIAGARVEADGRLQGHTDRKGRLTARGIDASPAPMQVSHPDYASVMLDGTLAPGPVVVQLERLGSLTATLEQAGKAVPAGVQALLWAKGGRSPLQSRTDTRGRVLFRGLAAGDHFLVVPEYRTLPRKVRITDEAVRRVIAVDGVATLRGTVRHHDGAPAANLTIRLLSAEHGYTWGGPPSRTDLAGRYVIERVPTGIQTLAVHKNPRDSRLARVPFVVEVGHATEVVRDITLPACSNVIRGRVRRKNGAPAANVIVQSTYLGANREWPEHLAGWTRTDRRGRFLLLSQRDGPHLVRALGPTGTVFSEQTELSEGETLDLELRAAGGKGVFVRGRVRNSDGSPSWLTRCSVVDAQGRTTGPFAGTTGWSRTSAYRVGPLQPGQYRMQFFGRGCRAAEATVEVGSKDVELDLDLQRHP